MNRPVPFLAPAPAPVSAPAAEPAREGVLPRLGRETLGQAGPDATLPGFDPCALRPGILHFGCGAFHRGHQALLTQRAIEAEIDPAHAHALTARLPPWGIVSTSLRTPAAIEGLKAQSGLYSVIERGPESTRIDVVGTLRRLVFVPEEPQAVAAAFTDAAIRIVTLTISPAGYGLDATTGRLDPTNPDVVADLRVDAPQSAIGLLVDGLARRRASGLVPPVVLSCDNMPGNGRLLRQAAVDFAALRGDDRLAEWIGGRVQFPCTMVDRIVPAPTEADRAEASAVLGLNDAMAISAEPFCQWVIETFDGPRPRWEEAGVDFVADVEPWETAKLRLLNGGHLALAWLGLLAGYETVADAIDDPDLFRFMLRFMLDEQRPTLGPGFADSAAYARRLLGRWRNRGIVDALVRVGRDGSVKLPMRLLAPLRENLAAGRPAPCTMLAIAAWMRCASGRDASGRAIEVADPMTETLQALSRAAGDDREALVDAFLGLTEVFGTDLLQDPTFRRALKQALALLDEVGARGAAAACAAGLVTWDR